MSPKEPPEKFTEWRIVGQPRADEDYVFTWSPERTPDIHPDEQEQAARRTLARMASDWGWEWDVPPRLQLRTVIRTEWCDAPVPQVRRNDE